MKNQKSYEEVEKDEVKYYFDVLQDNTCVNISEITGFSINFIIPVLTEYTQPTDKFLLLNEKL